MHEGKHMIPTVDLKTLAKTALSFVSHLSTVLDFVSAADPVFHGAPVVIFITAKKGDDWAALDIGMCSQNIMLAAKSLGLDTCPIGFATLIEKTAEYAELNIPLDQKIHLAIIVGYGAEEPKVHPRDVSNTFYL
jgi:nitroreductase